MKCEDLAEYLLDIDLANCSDELRDHLENCGKCRAEFDAQSFVYRMLAIKRHEVPDHDLEADILAGVRSKLFRDAKSDLSRFRFSDLRWFVKPVLQMAAAALIIVLAGSYFFKGGDAIDQPNLAHQGGYHHQLDLPLISRTAPEWLVPDTNMAPEQIQYGPLRSRLVDLELEGQ